MRSVIEATMTGWSGHHKRTSSVLLTLLSDAATRRKELTAGERTLIVACEFWAAVMNRTLAQHLGRHIGSRLRAAEQALSAIGAQYVATVLRQGQLELGKRHPHAAQQQLVAGMEASLARIDEPVDNLLELYTIDLICEHLPRRSQIRS
jgi:hypothetical protein